MRVAIVHDWLVGMRGGERCLELLCERFPDAHLYTAFYRSDRLSPRLRDHRTFVSCLQDIPGSLSYYRHLLPLYP
ncbi:MAG: hypothetical protein KDD69_16195, partial [Bdellovibrionales bacterium]|nr:hypothetical protein [Bdellovibrionales bacterium]